MRDHCILLAMLRRNAVLILLACGAALAQQVPQTVRIEPLRPVEELRAEALKAQPILNVPFSDIASK